MCCGILAISIPAQVVDVLAVFYSSLIEHEPLWSQCPALGIGVFVIVIVVTDVWYKYSISSSLYVVVVVVLIVSVGPKHEQMCDGVGMRSSIGSWRYARPHH